MNHNKIPVYPKDFDAHITDTEQRLLEVGQAPLVSIEEELHLLEPEHGENPYRIPRSVKNDPDNAYQAMNRRQLHTQVREDARDTVAALQPSNDEERERQKEWLDQVDDFETGDLINYLIYDGLSKASLRKGDPDTSNYYAALAASAANPLEFRFGKGIFQSGYYDNPGTSEVRIAPTSPVEALRRRSLLIAKVTSLCMKYGVDAQLYERPHINFSLHDVSGEQPQEMFTMADEQGRTVMRSAISGISALYMEGLTARPKTEAMYAKSHRFWLQNPNFDERFKYPDGTLTTSQDKVTSLRVLPNRLELRSGLPISNDAGSLAQRIFLATAGTYLGVNHPELLEGYPTPEIVDRALLVPTEHYRKERDLHLLRAFEHARGEPDEHGVLHFKPENAYVFMTFTAGSKFIKELTGVDYDNSVGDVGFESIFATITSGEDGVLTCDEENFRKWWAGLGERMQMMFEAYDIDDEAAPFIASRVSTIRFEGMVTSIEHTAKFSPDTIHKLADQVIASPLIGHFMDDAQRQAFAEWLLSRDKAR